MAPAIVGWKDIRESTDLVDTQRWMESLPDELAAQRLILQRLLEAVARHEPFRWLEFGCSVAQGRGDRWSDLDLGLGLADDAWPEALELLAQLVERLGEPVDALYHQLSAFGSQPHLRAFVEYTNGVQLDLVAMPAHLPKGKQPENLILYDPDGLRAESWDASVLQPDAASIREWIFLGWVALSDLAKYLRRGSLWEALEQLHEARSQVWRLWAAAKRLRYPLYGLTIVLDHPEAGVPPGMDDTVASLDPMNLRQAGLACAVLLCETSEAAANEFAADVPHAFARLVHDRLSDVTLEHTK